MRVIKPVSTLSHAIRQGGVGGARGNWRDGL